MARNGNTGCGVAWVVICAMILIIVFLKDTIKSSEEFVYFIFIVAFVGAIIYLVYWLNQKYK